ncbi:hypothetical protein CDL12_24486 [Handroanthus impetiginosus]|uniref:Uncharacterized protein n=1 Tax=Handroanthus impetiginosus TaxID=429701 RepID=A0A2G9GCG4_9LAMI|nr:hypothetical protein CDL12_24486 [Handroanthus impetiginosus]
MASFSQPPFFSSLTPIKKNTLAFSPQPKSFLTFKNSKISSSNSDSSPNSQENSPESQLPEQDPIKLAFARGSTQSSTPAPKILQSRLQRPYAETSGSNDDGTKIDEPKNGDEEKEVPLAVKIAIEKAKEYKKSKSLEKSKEAASKLVQNLGMESAEKEAASKNVQNLGMESAESDEKNDGWKPDEGKDGEKEVPLAVKLALEKAREYEENKSVVGSDTGGVGGSKILDSEISYITPRGNIKNNDLLHET